MAKTDTMESIEYSSMWDDIFRMSKEELVQICSDQLDEENLDALQRRLTELGEFDLSLLVMDSMLKSDKTNPAVEYTNIFEKVIFYWMSKKNYGKAIHVLDNYHQFDAQHRQSYRACFILRQRILCGLLLGHKETNITSLLAQLCEMDSNIMHFYYEVAMELDGLNRLDERRHYLMKGYDLAKQKEDAFWTNTFKSLLN